MTCLFSEGNRKCWLPKNHFQPHRILVVENNKLGTLSRYNDRLDKL